MYKQIVTVRNKTGLHARPASEFVKCASKYSSRIKILNVKNEDEEANAKSIVMVLSLCLVQGSEVEIRAVGSDEKEAVEALVSLIEGGFGELE